MSNNSWGNKRRLPHFALESGQRGQAIVLIALMLVLLLGMTAVAIDGGGLLFLQRDAQNAADAGVIVGAYALCNGRENEAGTLAIQGATENGFQDAGSNTNAEVIEVDTYCMYHTGNGGTCTGPIDLADLPVEVQDYADQFIRMEIKAYKPVYFAQLVYDAPLSVTVSAVAQCEPPSAPGSVPALRGLRDCDSTCGGGDNSVDFTGADMLVTGGVESGCDCRFNGNAARPSEVEDGVVCRVVDENGTTYDPPATEGEAGSSEDPLAEIYPVTAFQPGGYYAVIAGNDTCPNDTFDPDADCYHEMDGNDFGNVNGEVFEGLYFMSGKFQTSGTIEVGAKGATFINVDDDINFSTMIGVKPYQQAGFLLAATYQDAMCVETAIRGPNSQGEWSGIIYAPRAGCTMSFSDNYVSYGAIICQSVQLSGSDFELHFDPLMLPRKPGSTSGNQ